MTKILLAAALAAAAVLTMTAGAEAKATKTMMHSHHHGASCKGEFMYMDTKAHKCADARAK